MFRRATPADLDAIESSYEEHFTHEEQHGAFTIWKRGVYPTRKTAEDAMEEGHLYVLEEGGALLSSVIVDQNQSAEYGKVDWPVCAEPDEVMVIHLLVVRPSLAGRGIGRRTVRAICEMAKRAGCKVVRLDTGGQNIPARTLYTKCGFVLAAEGSMAVGGVLAHKGHLFFEYDLAKLPDAACDPGNHSIEKK